MNDTKYSVLMSVYCKEKAEFLQESMESIYNQTVPTDDFVLVCDGVLNESLEAVIGEMQVMFGEALHVVRLEKNCGLGNALNIGMKHCRHELVARMDSDDISCPERCEKQLNIFCNKPETSIVSGTVLEFRDKPDMITGKRELPETHEEICRFSRKRSPFNHPAVMLKKIAVENAGGYKETYHLLEDYYLWIRMLMNGCIGYNIREPVLYMRTSNDIYIRRGGKQYAEEILSFHKWLKKLRWINAGEYIVYVVPHALLCLLPNSIRATIYKLLH